MTAATPDPSHSHAEIPAKIGPYLIIGLYEEGGVSRLLLGRNPDSEELVIIKVPKFAVLSQDQALRLFSKESKIADTPQHPNIVKIIDSGQDQEIPFVCMEFVRGASLFKRLKQNPLPLRRAIDALMQIGHALHHLHSYGIVHGDLKPENILINEEGQVKLIDFGISSQIPQDLQPQTGDSKTQLLGGTPLYMGPELRQEGKSPTPQSDIYSLGIIAFELALGKITHGKVILSLAPKGLQPILARALQPDPKSRYQNVGEFLDDLSKYNISGGFQKDKQGIDYFFELFDELESARTKLLESHWKEELQTHKHIGFSSSTRMSQYSLYAGLKIVKEGSLTHSIFAHMNHSGALGIIDSYCFDALWQNFSDGHAFNPYATTAASMTIDAQKMIWSISRSDWGYFYLCRASQIIEIQTSCPIQEGDKLLFIGMAATPTSRVSNYSETNEVLLAPLLEPPKALSPQQFTESLLQHLLLLKMGAPESFPICVYAYYVQ